MLLSEIFKNAPNVLIEQLSCDSRLPMKNCIFFCIKGIKYNGHEFVDEAINNGASVIVYSEEIDTNRNAVFVKVSNVEDILIQISSRFYDNPQNKLDSYIVSGTNGRSSVSTIIKEFISKYMKCASIGVFGIDDGENTLLSNQPTLTILDTQKYLKHFVDCNCDACILEGKAISLAYKKLNMIHPKAFVYTCTSTESTDYIELAKDYVDTIKRYIYTLDNSTLIVLNRDDEAFNELFKASGDKVVTYGKNNESDYQITDIHMFKDETIFTLKHDRIFQIRTSLIGEVNVYNIVAALATLCENGYSLDELVTYIKDFESIDGVYDRLKFDEYNIVVDCAISADSYLNVLNYANEVTLDNNKIISLISINSSDGEQRIKSIISVADEMSDQLIITIDDTYESDASDEIDAAISYIEKSNYLVIEDREGAIEEAIELMNKNDTLLILGKGNENYEYQGLVKKSYNGDKNIAYKYMNKRLKEESLIIE